MNSKFKGGIISLRGVGRFLGANRSGSIVSEHIGITFAVIKENLEVT